uniref:Musashi RNA binding protein 2 n=1 Tax=Coturnix japonica TaxID=93934 RepID=A0A8C2UA33_COTJA
MEADGSQATSGGPGEAQHDPGKMFIGGLSWQTSPDSLRDYFSKFGEIRECMVMRDPTTKRSRGFGFVTFMDQAGVDKVLAQSRHELDSKTVGGRSQRRAGFGSNSRKRQLFILFCIFSALIPILPAGRWLLPTPHVLSSDDIEKNPRVKPNFLWRSAAGGFLRGALRGCDGW